jgi:type IV pilus assembly protein PilC
VLTVATGILVLMMTYIVPRFQNVFTGLLEGRAMPAFTLLVMRISETVQHRFPLVALLTAALGVAVLLALRTTWGRWTFDRLKLAMPIVGPVFRKVAISRFSRTLGTLVGSGVPILQALNIVKETAGNLIVGQVVATVHDRVKEGDPIAPSLKVSRVFPAMVAGMVDVGEQTGALPDMLMKIADNYDDEVDNAVSAMTSLLEPIMIVFLAVIVGSIVIALFLPLVQVTTFGDLPGDR